jgi:hypothetical protein
MGVKAYVKVLGVGVLMSLFAGCAEPPQQEIDAAKAAIEAAKAAEADTYAASEHQAAQDSLSAAMAEIDAQSREFAIFRSYDKASSLLKASVSAATMAQQNAVENKARMQTEVQELMTQVQTALEETKGLLTKAPRGKESQAALEAIKQDLATVESSLPEITVLINNSQLFEARDRLRAGLDKTTAITNEINDAIAKKTGLTKRSA